MSREMINKGMRLFELFDKKDPYYAAYDEDMDDSLNPASAEYRENEESANKKRYAKNGTNIVTKPEDDEMDSWTSEPKDDEWQSPGYRGREESKANAGMPHKKYQRYNPDYFVPEKPDNPNIL